MGIVDRASGILTQTDAWANQGGLNRVIVRGLFAGPLGAVGLSLIAGIEATASGIISLIMAMISPGIEFFRALGEVIGIIPAGASISASSLNDFGVVAVLIGFGLVLVVIFMFNYARENWFEDADLPISRIDLPFFGEDEDDD